MTLPPDAAEQAYADIAGGIIADHPGWAGGHEVQGFWAEHDTTRIEHISTPTAFRTILAAVAEAAARTAQEQG